MLFGWGCRTGPMPLGDPSVYNLLCVFDGHNGLQAALHLQEKLEKVSLLALKRSG
jgi:hypothetical protein